MQARAGAQLRPKSEDSLVGDLERLARSGLLKDRARGRAGELSGNATAVDERAYAGSAPRGLRRRSHDTDPVTNLRSPAGSCSAAPDAVACPPKVRWGGLQVHPSFER
jgi:hypothetical protein